MSDLLFSDFLRLTVTPTTTPIITPPSKSEEISLAEIKSIDASFEFRDSGTNNAKATDWTQDSFGMEGPSTEAIAHNNSLDQSFPESTEPNPSMVNDLRDSNYSYINTFERKSSKATPPVTFPAINTGSAPSPETSDTLTIHLFADDDKTRERNLEKLLTHGYFNYGIADSRVRKAIIEQLSMGDCTRTMAKTKRQAPSTTHTEAKEDVNLKRPNLGTDLDDPTALFVQACWNVERKQKTTATYSASMTAMTPHSSVTNSQHMSPMPILAENSSVSTAFSASSFEPTCPKCYKPFKCKEIRPYTHNKQKDSSYHIYRCCETDFSNMSSLSGSKNKQFKDLDPADDHLHEWKYRTVKKGRGKWKLRCRGQDWTRCEHCKALYKDNHGSSSYHTRDRCTWSRLDDVNAGLAAAHFARD